MQHDHTAISERPVPASLVTRAVAAGAPQPVAVEAMRITRARFPRRGAVEGRMSARAEAYFWGVIRHRALQGAAPAVTRLLVIASLERELREAGHTPEAIRCEVARVHGVENRPSGGSADVSTRVLA